MEANEEIKRGLDEKAEKNTGGDSRISAKPGVSAGPHDKVEQVREILFGAQRDEYDRRFNRLEELLAKNTSSINSEMTEKLGAIRDEYDKRFALLEELFAKNIEEMISDIQDLKDKKVEKESVSKLLNGLLKLSRDLDVVREDKA
ncbi:MAG: hypothetical protein PHT28_03520 [Dehalococcoidales bacterium]|nr:hypothetical protein [Dehalococcoidales bacterium]MDD5402458.1 hypothetical protein [Dehalococcoidales bacterium]